MYVGTEAAFIKFGLDVQESQLITHGAGALELANFGQEPDSLRGTLYTIADPQHATVYVGLDDDDDVLMGLDVRLKREITRDGS